MNVNIFKRNKKFTLERVKISWFIFYIIVMHSSNIWGNYKDKYEKKKMARQSLYIKIKTRNSFNKF